MWTYLFLLGGLLLLLRGADWLVEGASALARKIGVPPLAIGLTIVAFGTSLPELLVNIFAATNNHASIAYGNILGSNIANIMLILGIGAIIMATKIPYTTVWHEIPFSFIATLILLVLSTDIIFGNGDNTLARVDGIILLLFLAAFLYYVYDMIKKERYVIKTVDKDHPYWKIWSMIFVGTVFLAIGGKLTVDNAVIIAKNLGISDFLISATILAVGTSLPELITTIVASYKKEFDIGIGNLVGSNIFNILAVLGITALINPVIVPAAATIHILLLLGCTILLFIFMFIGKHHTLDRWQGIILIIIYLAYVAFMIWGIIPTA